MHVIESHLGVRMPVALNKMDPEFSGLQQQLIIMLPSEQMHLMLLPRHQHPKHHYLSQ
jgi:hypothetical protein